MRTRRGVSLVQALEAEDLGAIKAFLPPGTFDFVTIAAWSCRLEGA
jgi:hypothetical protein